jgi:hypothetical protein
VKTILGSVPLVTAVALVTCLSASPRANADASARAHTTPVQFETEDIGSSVWEDGTISLAVPIVNLGTSTASDVRVTSISLRSFSINGTRTDGAVLPLSLGQIAPNLRRVLDTRFSGLPFASSYLLTVSGTYDILGGRFGGEKEGGEKEKKSGTHDVLGGRFGFSVHRWITPIRGTAETTPAQTNTVTRHFPVGHPLPPSTIIPDTESNPELGPPVPIGPPQTVVPVPPNNTPAMPEGSSGDVVFYHDTGTNQPLGLPPDPAAAAGGGVVLATDNTYLLLSTDGGTTFSNINPTTIFSEVDGGLCCDQVVTYVPSVDTFFWLLQYKQANPVPPNTVGANRLRLAIARPSAIAANIYNAWTYFDLQTSFFGLTNQWLDFPDLAYTNTFLYVSVDALPNSSATSVSNKGLIVSRASLTDLANPAVPTVSFSSYGPNQLPNQVRAYGSHLTQSSADAMYWAGHIDTSNLEVFVWPDASGTITPPHSTKFNGPYCNTDYSSVAPDKFQWIDTTRSSARGAVIGATRKPFSGLVPPGSPTPNGEVWFAWGAARDDSSCKNGRPQPYVLIARLDDQTLAAVGEYDIWNTPYAFAYPSLATSPDGEIGVSLGWGGPSNYGSTAAGYLGDYVVYYNEPSDSTIAWLRKDVMGNTIAESNTIVDANGNPIEKTRFGDFFVVRNSGPNNERFSSQGYAVNLANPAISNGCDGGSEGSDAMGNSTGVSLPSCTLHPHYVEWGRPPPPPTQ